MSRKRDKPGKTPIPPKPASARDIPWYLMAVVLAIPVLIVYWHVGDYAFTNLDDGVYVSENPVVLRGLTLEGVRWAFTTFHAANWHPLTWLSHMLDAEFFGPSPGWHHRMNVLYHLLNTELLFLVLWRMTGGMWQSAFVAALFGVHPLHVESVAWVAERKDVLSTLFWILAMGAYLRYVRKPGAGRYLLVAACFALGLLCKPMLVTLPFVLLLLDGWPLGRFAPAASSVPPSRKRYFPVFFRLVREKVPLLGLSAISCVVTYLAQAKGGSVSQLKQISFGMRISNAVVSYVAYLGKTVWPSSLAVLYPHPVNVGLGIPAWQVAGAVLLLAGVTFSAIRQWKRRPYLAVGWLWYLGTLVPVIGLVQVGAQALADRYTYVPLIGVFLAVAWGFPELLTGWRIRRYALMVSGGAVLVAFSVAAWSQVGYWRDSVTLFSRAVAVTDRNWLAMNNLGVSYSKIDQQQKAIGYFREALRIYPYDFQVWYNLGISYAKLGEHQQAIGSFREGLRIRPGHAVAWNNLGFSYNQLGEYRQAIGCFREVLRINPDDDMAWYSLGISYAKLGQFRQAISNFQEALRINPDSASAWYNLGASYGRIGKPGEAIEPFREAVRIQPDYGIAWLNLGAAYAELGQWDKVREVYRRLLQVDPAMAQKFLSALGPARGNLGQ